MTNCPVCNKSLQKITKGHIDTKTHQKNLNKAGIKPSEDPTLKLISSSKKKQEGDKDINYLKQKILKIEEKINYLHKNQEEIIKQLQSFLSGYKINEREDKNKKLNFNEIIRAIDKCVQNNNYESRWVKIDDIISILKLNRENDRNNFNSLLIKMFNKNLVDLAEGGDPKYPLIYQNRIFGMLAHQ